MNERKERGRDLDIEHESLHVKGAQHLGLPGFAAAFDGFGIMVWGLWLGIMRCYHETHLTRLISHGLLTPLPSTVPCTLNPESHNLDIIYATSHACKHSARTYTHTHTHTHTHIHTYILSLSLSLTHTHT